MRHCYLFGFDFGSWIGFAVFESLYRLLLSLALARLLLAYLRRGRRVSRLRTRPFWTSFECLLEDSKLIPQFKRFKRMVLLAIGATIGTL